MMKKSLFALFFSLVISGFFVGSVDAMKYTVNGNTQIAIPSDETDGVTIDWGDETAILLTVCPTIFLEEIQQDVKRCSYNYTGEHTVTITNPNHTRVETIYLSNSNITSIIDFEGFPNLKMVYLDENFIEHINYSGFSGLSNSRVATVFLRNNQINNFLTPIDKITSLYLNNLGFQQGNRLTTIPETIRSKRGDTMIKLSNSVSYGDTSKPHLADLRYNLIKFVGLTGYYYSGYDNNHFVRFGFDYENPETPTYYYKVLHNGEDVENTTGTTISNEISIDTPLVPGDYTFKVCIYGDDVCDYNGENVYNFSVDYDSDIIFDTYPSNTIYSTDDIAFTWHKEGNYPDELIDRYYYTLTKDGVVVSSGYTSIGPYGYGSYSPDAANWENGNYEFTVYIVDSQGNNLQDYNGNDIYKSTSFELMINNTITIVKPSSDIQSEGMGAIEVPIERYTENQLFDRFKYIITDNDLNCGLYRNENGDMITVMRNNENVVYNNQKYTYSGSTLLPEGNHYVLCVQMYNDDVFIGFAETSPFEVDIVTGDIRIISPSVFTGEGQNPIDVEFEWMTTSSTADGYKYYVVPNINNNGLCEETNSIDGITTTYYGEGTALLRNGEYLLCVDMYAGDTKIGSAEKSFTVNIIPKLTITSPQNNNSITVGNATFDWEGEAQDPYSIDHYAYSLYLKGTQKPGKTNIEGGSFTRTLDDGTYVFELDMYYKSGDTVAITPITKSVEFTMAIDTPANIIISSPSLDNQEFTEYDATETNKSNVTLSWSGVGTQYDYYKYKLDNRDSYITLHKSDAPNGEYSTNVKLPNGTYTLTVEMYNNVGSKIDTKTRIFKVNIPTTVEIKSPVTGVSILSATTDFSREGFTPYTCVNYEYIVTGPNDYSRTNQMSCSETGFELRNLSDGTYTFKIRMKYNDGVDMYTDYESSAFSVNASTNKYLNIISPTSGANYVPVSGTNYWGDYEVPVIFKWNGGGSPLISGYTYKLIDSNSHVIFSGNINKNDSGEYSAPTKSLPQGSYMFEINMIDSDGTLIMKQSHNFKVDLPARIKITNPLAGTTVTTSSAKITWTGFRDTFTGYNYDLTSVEGYNYVGFTTTNSFDLNDLKNGSYTLTVGLSSNGRYVVSDTIEFTVSIPKKSSGGGGGGGSSSKAHPTNSLSVAITNDSPNTNDWIDVKVDVKDKYTGKVDFSKMQYYSGGEWIDIPVTSKNYVSDCSDDAKLGYVNFSSSDNGEKELSEFLKISKKGNYRIYAEDKDGYIDYVQFYVGNGGNNTVRTMTARVDSKPTDTEDEVYIARSCKKYKITYSDSLNVYTSPNLNMSEYFMNKDYFKRYIDSKNKYKDGCPTNVGWISTNYSDKSNDNSRYTAPNGKVYFITGKEGSYYSNELNKELKTPTSFSTIQQLKYYIRDRNPLINMATLGPVK